MGLLRSAVAVVASTLIVGAGPAVAQTKLTLGYTGVSDFAAAFVAEEHGLFKKHGLDVELQQIALNSTLPAALQSNAIQIGGAAPSMLLQAADGGLELQAVAGATVNVRTSPNPGVVVRVGSGIAGPQDLIGRRVGVPGLNATLHVLLRRWLTDKGVDYRKVTFVETPLPQMNDILKSGAVDAVVAAEPFMGRMVQAGTGAVVAHLAADLPEGMINLLYASTREWATRNPTTIRAFREALADAVTLIARDPEAARADIGKYIKVPAPVLAALPMPRFDTSISAAGLRFWNDTMRQQDMLRTSLDLAGLVAP